MARTEKTTKAETKIKVADNNFLLNNKTEIAIKRLKKEFTEPHKKMARAKITINKENRILFLHVFPLNQRSNEHSIAKAKSIPEMTEFSRKLTPFILFPKFQSLAETSTCETIAMTAVKKPMSITELERKELLSFFACRVARPNTKAKPRSPSLKPTQKTSSQFLLTRSCLKENKRAPKEKE